MTDVSRTILDRLKGTADLAAAVVHDNETMVESSSSTRSMSNQMTESAEEIAKAVEALRTELKAILDAAAAGVGGRLSAAE